MDHGDNCIDVGANYREAIASYNESERDSATMREHEELDALGEEQYERDKEDLLYALHSAAQQARRFGFSEKDIINAIRLDI